MHQKSNHIKNKETHNTSLLHKLLHIVISLVKSFLPASFRLKLYNLFNTIICNSVNIAGVRKIAQTGIRSDKCLAAGCLPLLVHFHSPIPDFKDLELRGVWNKRSSLPGIDFRPLAQKQLLLELGRQYGEECDWAPDPTNDPREFYTENNRFSFGCAASTHTIVRQFKPNRIVEVGSGCSSLVMSAAVLRNQRDTGRHTQYTIIDPYPGKPVASGLPGVSELIAERVEMMPIDFVDNLSEGDILFVDSGHCVRIGSDVNFLILDVLPRLAPGVLVHFHDIHMPFEYPQELYTNPSFRQFWSESYLLQAFLSFNAQYEILLAMQWLMTDEAGLFQKAFPHYNPKTHLQGSCSFWIRHKIE